MRDGAAAGSLVIKFGSEAGNGTKSDAAALPAGFGPDRSGFDPVCVAPGTDLEAAPQ